MDIANSNEEIRPAPSLLTRITTPAGGHYRRLFFAVDFFFLLFHVCLLVPEASSSAIFRRSRHAGLDPNLAYRDTIGNFVKPLNWNLHPDPAGLGLNRIPFDEGNSGYWYRYERMADLNAGQRLAASCSLSYTDDILTQRRGVIIRERQRGLEKWDFRSPYVGST